MAPIDIAAIAHAAMATHAAITSRKLWKPWPLLSTIEKNKWASCCQWTADNIRAGPAATWTAIRPADAAVEFDKASTDEQERLFIFRAIVGACHGWRPQKKGLG